jgi:MFS family permease
LAVGSTGQDERTQAISTGKVVLIVIILFLTYLLSWYDRSLFAVLLQPIKLSLGLSDSQAGLVTGLAYNVLSLLAILPLAQAGDRSSHFGVLLLSLITWSAATALCGAAGGFTSLFLYRMIVGLGEAGAQPATHALVSGTLPVHLRARALSVIGVGSGVGVLCGGWIGGAMGEALGWRAAFWAAGLIGVIVALALVACRSLLAGPKRETRPRASIAEALRTFARRRSYVWLLLAICFASIGYYTVQGWIPTYLARIFNLQPSAAGGLFSLSCVAPLLVGTICGGLLSDKLSRTRPEAPIWILMLSFGGSAPFLYLFYMQSALEPALILLAISSFLIGLYIGPVYGIVQLLAEPHLRATSTALMVLVSGIFGGTIGPLVIGVLNDHWQKAYGIAAIRYSMPTLLIAHLICLWPALCAARHVRNDLRELREAAA